MDWEKADMENEVLPQKAQFNSWSRHMPELQAQPPVRGVQEEAD